MRAVILASLLCGASLPGLAATSVLDPRVSLDVKDQPLSRVLETIAQQAGLRPAAWLSPRYLEAMSPELRARQNPAVTLRAENEPLRAVVDRLRIQVPNLGLANNGFSWLYSLDQVPRWDTAPRVAAGAYRVFLTALTTELAERFTYTANVLPSSRRTRVSLHIAANNEVAARALIGVAEPFTLSLDGQPVAARPLPPTALYRGTGSALEALSPSLLFDPYASEPKLISRLTGSIRACGEAREAVVDFGDLGQPDQMQTSGDVDVTLVRAGPATRTYRSFDSKPLTDMAEVELLVGLAKTPTLALVAESGGQPLPGTNPRPAQGIADPTVVYGLGGLAVPWAPRVLLDAAEGTSALTIVQATFEPAKQPDRVNLRCLAVRPQPISADARLLVGLVDFGQRVVEYPFSLADIALPAAAPAAAATP